MALVLITPPESMPVSLVEAKAQCRRDGDVEDDVVSGYLAAAVRRCERKVGQQFVTATWRLLLDRFPKEHGGLIEMPRAPLASVSWVKYYDADNELQTLAGSSYDVDTAGRPGRIVPAYGYSWPSTRSRLNAVEIEFVAGYGAAADVPETIKQAILMIVAHWFKNREAAAAESIKEIDFAVSDLLGLEWDGNYSRVGEE